jgi:hypothetical protein
VLKCRPPGNRNPEPEEVAQCSPHLAKQIALIQPKLIIAMGRFAAQTLLNSDASIASLRGRLHQYGGLPLIVTYHPAYLLRNLPDKSKAWEDLVSPGGRCSRLFPRLGGRMRVGVFGAREGEQPVDLLAMHPVVVLVPPLDERHGPGDEQAEDGDDDVDVVADVQQQRVERDHDQDRRCSR